MNDGGYKACASLWNLGYAKTEVKWLSWVVHHSYWWNADGKIIKMRKFSELRNVCLYQKPMSPPGPRRTNLPARLSVRYVA